MAAAATTIGYIGLGIMGGAMAANLLKAGHRVMVWNRTASKMKPLLDAGATACDSPKDMASRGPEVIFTNVSDTPDAEAVLFGDDGVAAGAKRGLIVVDHSTISPIATRAFAERLAEQGVTLLDAPVSGGDTGARAGTLSIMVGGPEDAFERVLPLLRAVGKSITRVGDSGAGQMCKACNQIAVVCNLLGVCEAMALAKKAGLDLQKMIEVVGAGAGGSWQLSKLGPKIAAGDHEPGFMVDLVLKDLGIVNDTARQHRLALPGASLAETLFRSVAANGGGGRGTQALAAAIERLGGFRYAED